MEAIRNKTPAQIRADVEGFAARYVEDWDAWLNGDPDGRPELFGRILRKWQATRPLPMRRLRKEAQHQAPFLEDLWQAAEEPVRVLADLSVVTIADRTPAQQGALETLWTNFSRLPSSGVGSCVAITKGMLLVTDGRIGPAFDSQVRRKLRVARPTTCAEWLAILQEIGEDIALFERAHGPITACVPCRFTHLAYGRLYDMALGPR
jgi:hypothetical protein